MHNKVKPEQYFTVSSTKKVNVFQVSLTAVREEASTQPSNKYNKHLTSLGSKHLHDGSTVNTNEALI